MREKILVIDCETGGLDSEQHSLLSIGGVVLDIKKSQIIDLFSFYIKEPTLTVQQEALDVNQINLNLIIKCGLSPQNAVEEITNKIQHEFGFGNKVLLAGHNVGFDVAFLKRLFRLANCSNLYKNYFLHRVIDTASIAQFLELVNQAPEGTSSLDSILKFTKVPILNKKRHCAVDDANLTAQALLKLINIFKGKNKETYDKEI